MRTIFAICSFLLCVFFSLLTALMCFAQNNISYSDKIALPFLLITPDARAAGMGDLGVSTSPDIYSIYWNAAKYAFADQTSGIGISITPWQRQLAEDMNVFYLSGYHQVDQVQTIAASIKYFMLGRNVFTDSQGNESSTYKPMDLSIDFAYIRKLSEVLSLATTLKYIRSDIVVLDFVQGQGVVGQDFAVDVGVFYQKPIYVGGKDGTLAFGASIANLGPNIKYGLVDLPMPIVAKLGGAFMGSMDNYIKYAFSLELNKLIVKNTPGASNISAGLEVLLASKFAVRTGYYQSETIPEKGKYFTAGFGLDYLNFSLNFSYLFPTQEFSIMNNTIRYALGYTIGKKNNHLRQR
ncbi:MAG: PorV/PorQ family protein [Candidatus Pedobacter colombiensis]|uniref:PorV/PorQ family protein n=1 Tax=Candidatus Pedobacter colombiensis TaxID=3121371 RepID=A0AAJ6B6C9_9SPHI|nr:PorV/PorQ family protein [Pedobacter sp.]WEK19817.1 MAG: PorV/PorQ family protein [Pedobacter sp.]